MTIRLLERRSKNTITSPGSTYRENSPSETSGLIAELEQVESSPIVVAARETGLQPLPRVQNAPGW